MLTKVMILVKSMNVGGTEKALLNMLELMNPSQYAVDLYLLEKIGRGGYMEDIPSWVNVKIVEDYKSLKSWVENPPLKVAKQLVKRGQIISTLSLLMTHLVYKVSDDRTLYYKMILSHMKKVEKFYDVAIAYTGPFDFITSFVLTNVVAKKYLQWIHFDVSKIGFDEKFARKKYPCFEQIIVVSSEAAKQLEQRIPNIKDKIKVIPNFVPTLSCMQKAEEYEAYPNGNYFKILTVGRLSSEKGQIIIPDVVNALLKMGIYNIRWYIVGEGNQRKKIDERARELNVIDYIKMIGLEKNPYPYYKGTDIYVQTSIHEGYCLTIAEAKIFNKYIVSTDVAGAYDQIKDMQTGKIVERKVMNIAESIYQYWVSWKNEYN